MIDAKNLVVPDAYISSHQQNPVHYCTYYIEVGQNFHLVLEPVVWVF